MRCESVRDALPALARGGLDEDDARAIRAHIASCDECADAWAVVGAIAAARVTVPAGLADRVAGHVHQRAVRGLAPRRTSPARWLGGFGIAAAAVLALVIAWPERAVEDPRTLEMAKPVAVQDPFLNETLFGSTTPTEAELDSMIRTAAVDPAALPPLTAEPPADGDAEIAPLAMDVGDALGDWPGVDGMSAGMMMIDDLSVDEMTILLQEMDT